MKPRIGISACVLGHNVRYNGGNTKLDWIVGTLAAHAELVPLCPEVEMGLGTPREALRLSRPVKRGPLVLVSSRTAQDRTALARETAQRLVSQLPADLDAYILMNLSPLCGLERVKVYDHNTVPSPLGSGIFAQILTAERPELLVVEAGRLNDPAQRERFVMRLFTLKRFAECERSVSALQAFHRSHKFLLMAHGEKHLRELGRIAADTRRRTLEASFGAYKSALVKTLRETPNRRLLTDSLTHMYGFLKNDLAEVERHGILARIEDYRRGELPLLVPLSLLAFANERACNQYLKQQTLFQPYPEMGLRSGL